MKQEDWLMVLYCAVAAFVFMALLCMSSCNTPKVVTMTEYRDRVQHDTITQTDSVYISHVERIEGETKYILDTIFKYKYLDKYAYEYIHDSIPYPVEVQVPVRMRNGYDKFVSWGFWVLVVLLLLRFAWWVFKKYYLHR